MQKQQTEIIITAGLIVVLIIASLASFKKKEGGKKPASAKPGSLQVKPISPNLPATPAITKESVPSGDEKTSNPQIERANLSWGRDPFKLSLDKEYQRGDLALKGISFAKDKQGFAFINNEIVKKGDKVGDYEVIEVDKDKVMLKKGNQNFYLTLPEK